MNVLNNKGTMATACNSLINHTESENSLLQWLCISDAHYRSVQDRDEGSSNGCAQIMLLLHGR